MAQVKDGVSRAFGAKLRTGLASGTRGSVRSFLSGFVATVALQSSTATALMVASFVERQLVKPRIAQIVLLGANVGTAVTAWIVATGIEWLSALVILAGIVLYRSGSTSRQGGGTALIGIGLMLLSLHLLSAATMRSGLRLSFPDWMNSFHRRSGASASFAALLARRQVARAKCRANGTRHSSGRRAETREGSKLRQEISEDIERAGQED